MKTLIVLTPGMEFRIKCARFHAVPNETQNCFFIWAQDTEGQTVAVIPFVEEAYFDGMVDSRNTR